MIIPGGNGIHSGDFDQLVKSGTTPPPKTALVTKVQPNGGVMDPVHPNLALGITLKMNSSSTEGVWAHNSIAKLALPPPAHPICTLTATKAVVGQNVKVPITVNIAGVAAGLYYPQTAAQLYPDPTLIPSQQPGNFAFKSMKSITNSVRRTTLGPATTFTIVTPRILSVTDPGSAPLGTAPLTTVPVYIPAYVVAADDTQHACKYTVINEENAADCRLFVDSYSLAAPTGANLPPPPIPAATCNATPAAGSKSGSLSCLPSADPIMPAVSASNPYGLPVCADIGYVLLGVFDPATTKVTIKDATGLDVTALTLYKSGSTLAFCPAKGMSGQYKISMKVNGANGPGSCLANVGVADEKQVSPISKKAENCPLFFGTGTNSKAVSQSFNVHVVHPGLDTTFPVGFSATFDVTTPDASSFETNTYAFSPWDAVACPAGARCFGVPFLSKANKENFFVIINNADAANCTATGVNRINLGCFAADTMITMADGSQKAISAIKVGEQVWNPIRKHASAVTFISIGFEKAALIALSLGSAAPLQLTTGHPVPTRRGILRADAVRPGDQIMDRMGEGTAYTFSRGTWDQAHSVLTFSDKGPKNSATSVLQRQGNLQVDGYPLVTLANTA